MIAGPKSVNAGGLVGALKMHGEIRNVGFLRDFFQLVFLVHYRTCGASDEIADSEAR